MHNQKKDAYIVVILSILIFLMLGVGMYFVKKGTDTTAETEVAETQPTIEDVAILESFDAFIADDLAAAKDAALAVPKVFWINEDATVAPEPNPECYGSTTDPASLQWLIDEAAELLDGQELTFSTDVEIMKNSEVLYYLDDSTLVITWYQVFDNYAYTISEIKINHPSQFRRHVSDNDYNSPKCYPVESMAAEVNAVVASTADHYLGRNFGITVYDGIVYQIKYSERVDSCFVDSNGDLIFKPAGSFSTQEEAQAFVDENDIDFGLAFGPILIDNGELCVPNYYILGEINDKYARCALCQKDELHYLIVTANAYNPYYAAPTIKTFAKNVATLDVEKAYTLDGGFTGAIVMNDEKVSLLRDDLARPTGDMIYFATATPSATNETGSD